jgi:thiol-disulfide isomerase/thioredoxin
MMMKTALLALAALVALAAAPTLRAQEQIGIQLGAKAPGALVETLEGKSVDIARYFGKSPVLIEFWATWCGNCKQLEPQLLSTAKKYGGQVKFLTVAVSVNQSPERVKLYAQKHGLTSEMLYDRRGNAVVAYDAPATSYIVVVDKNGKVVYTGLGPEQNLDGAVRKAL